MQGAGFTDWILSKSNLGLTVAPTYQLQLNILDCTNTKILREIQLLNILGKSCSGVTCSSSRQWLFLEFKA